jgi:hypothetical protein
MKTPSVVLALLCALVVTACDPSDSSGPAETSSTVEPKEAATYQDARLFVNDLNERLQLIDASKCTMKDPDLQSAYAKKIPNEGAAVCRFSDGTPLYVLIVTSGEDTYQRHFSDAHGPNVYLRGPTWIAITPHTAPANALAVIRRELGATG